MALKYHEYASFEPNKIIKKVATNIIEKSILTGFKRRHFTYFLVVTDHLSFSSSRNRCEHKSQPIKRLEHEDDGFTVSQKFEKLLMRKKVGRHLATTSFGFFSHLDSCF